MIITALYYALPGFVANMMPIFVRRRFRFLAVPVDMGRRLGSRQIFGSHKTYRGFVFGILGAVATACLQAVVYKNGWLHGVAYVDYSRPVLLGAALGLGALTGDLVRSFFKRRAGLKPGAKWFPWDQLDYVIGIVAFAPVVRPFTWQMALALLILGPILHIAVTRTANLLGLRKEKW